MSWPMSGPLNEAWMCQGHLSLDVPGGISAPPPQVKAGSRLDVSMTKDHAWPELSAPPKPLGRPHAPCLFSGKHQQPCAQLVTKQQEFMLKIDVVYALPLLRLP